MKATMQRYGLTGSPLPPRLSLLALALIISQSGMAADEGWYGGLSAGRSQADINDEAIVFRNTGDGFATTSLTKFDDDIGYKLFLGYQVNSNFAVEAGYFTLGEFGYMTELKPDATMRGDTRMMGLNIDLVGSVPLGDRFSVIGRVGAIYARTRNQFSGHGPVTIDTFNTSDRDANFKVGLGLQYDLSDNLAMRLEAEHYRIDDHFRSGGNIELFSVGAVYRFGAKAAPPPPAPARVVAPAPAPTPRATPPPPPAPAPAPQPTVVSFSADSLFDFNSSTVNSAGMGELDRLAADLRGVDFERIQVTGHTDRIGSQADNQRLSNARAEAVKAYLVRSANIAAARINTRGVASSEPMTTLAQCGNDMPRARLIVCLAPDRRVEVEVSGTRARP